MSPLSLFYAALALDAFDTETKAKAANAREADKDVEDNDAEASNIDVRVGQKFFYGRALLPLPLFHAAQGSGNL